MAIKMADIIARVTSQTQYSALLAGDQFGFLSAKQYGAVGDGVTDDSAAILEMLSAASSSTNKAIYFPTGVYKVDNVTLTSTNFSGYYLFGDNASFIGITKDIEQIGNTVGKLSDLNTTNKDSIVDAINELEAESVVGVLTTRGDIVSRDSTGTIRVGIGSPLQYIVAGNTSDATPLKYIDSPQKTLTTAGDLLYASAPNTINRVAIGTNLQNLSVNATTDGFSYIDSPQKVLTAKGDMLTSTGANTLSRIAASNSSEGKIIQVSNGLPSFQPKINMLVITSTSGYVWSPPISATYEVTVTGGGGAGGCAYTTQRDRGCGGGGGGTAIYVGTLSSSEAITVTIGVGGSFANTTNTSGAPGTASSFGTYATANGGNGGRASGAYYSQGGIATGGTINICGGTGMPGLNVLNDNEPLQLGGATYWGGGSMSTELGCPGTGGRGGYVGGSTSYSSGQKGICVIRW